jgi:aminotransferase
MFDNNTINLELLKKRAHNLRWATVADGVIPLTAADPYFPGAPEISEAICSFAKDRYYCYGPAEGLTDFKESVANYFQVKRNVPVSPAFTFPFDSAAFGIFVTCKIVLSAGDEANIF